MAEFDDADYNLIKNHTWYYANNAVVANIKKDHKYTTIKMHRFLLNVSNPKDIVDHIDCNPLNNRRVNLRICNNSENLRNRGKSKNNKSGYKGVSMHSNGKKWVATICVNNKQKYLGIFPNPLEASNAYKEAARNLHGEYARFEK